MATKKDPEWVSYYLAWLTRENIVPGTGVRVTDTFIAGFLAGKEAATKAKPD